MKLQKRIESRDEEGLSLIEMVMAMVVFAIVALSAYPLFLNSIQMVSLNNLTTAATITTNDLLEQIRNNPTCTNLETKAATTNEFADKRGIKYRIVISLPEGCDEAQSVPFKITATRVKDSKILLEQGAQVLIPPRNGLFELD